VAKRVTVANGGVGGTRILIGLCLFDLWVPLFAGSLGPHRLWRGIDDSQAVLARSNEPNHTIFQKT
jgi:hypothetical protein